MSDYGDIKRLLSLTEDMLERGVLNDDYEDRPKKLTRPQHRPVRPTRHIDENMEDIDKELGKVDPKLMQSKVEKLNLLLKKRYYEADEDIDEAKMFQFTFEDKGDYYEFGMPLTIVFGKKARQFAARYWNDIFDSADIRVKFEDNIEDALKSAGSITLSMKLNKNLTKEEE
jgi:hypothetical protein